MRYLVSRKEPRGERILLIESGARAVMETVLPHLLGNWADDYAFDLVTCYGGAPAGLPPGARIFHTSEFGSPELRAGLIRELRRRKYAYTGMICSAEPIMTKWKWLIALRIPAKVFIVNENGDYFWLNRENAPVLREFALVRLGLSGAGAVRTLGRLMLFPFTILFLLLYAFNAHARRALRRAIQTQ